MCEWHRIKFEDICKGGDSMSSVNDAVNSITNLFESGDIRLVVDIALIAMVVWFVIRGVNRLFETLVLGGISIISCNISVLRWITRTCCHSCRITCSN